MSRMTQADRDLRKRMIFIRNLLKESGAKLHGYDPGISFYVKDGKEYEKVNSMKQVDRWRYAHVDGAAWKWLEPILCELRTLRRLFFENPKNKSS